MKARVPSIGSTMNVAGAARRAWSAMASPSSDSQP